MKSLNSIAAFVGALVLTAVALVAIAIGVIWYLLQGTPFG